ncbi:hypothetical protein [Microbacterium pumilum]|uniref:DUF624 domain-containing protein n=1 Tax=Microbacterium pumilum TaxID=344165 RepID=A0ABP5D438_9MICO
MSAITTKREYKAARRADASGSGPTLEERPPARFPGAAAKFALFGEVLQTGLLIALVGILVITLPAALAAGIRHLRRYLHAEASPMTDFWRDVRRALPGGLVAGLIGAVAAAILVLDVNLAGSGLLPGGALIAVVGWAGLVVGAVALLVAAGAWTPERGWRAAVRSVPLVIRADLRGALFLAATAGFVGVATWMLVPLIVPALGCAALAVVAVPERRRAR